MASTPVYAGVAGMRVSPSLLFPRTHTHTYIAIPRAVCFPAHIAIYVLHKDVNMILYTRLISVIRFAPYNMYY